MSDAHVDPILVRCGFNNAEHVQVSVLRNRHWVSEELAEILMRQIRRSHYSDRVSLTNVVKTLPTTLHSLCYRYAETYAREIAKSYK